MYSTDSILYLYCFHRNLEVKEQVGAANQMHFIN